MKGLENVSTEMSVHVLAYNMKRCINMLGVNALLEAIRFFVRFLTSLIEVFGGFVGASQGRFIKY